MICGGGCGGGAVDVDPPARTAAECRELGARLPPRLPDRDDGLPRRETDPASEATAAWGDPAVVVRCGVPRPPSFTADALLVQVDSVAWFERQLDDEVVYTSVDRPVYVELRVPKDYQRQARYLTGIAAAVTSLPERTPEPAPLR